ncbi:MAG: hypothetical protein PHW86_00350 [Candidatus Bipolaricaulis sp.]|nr:hypothetical protein [Candidatus Bipolaricaulis sp.]
MNQDALDAIEKLWEHFVKARALCPYMSGGMLGAETYVAGDWYRARGATYFVRPSRPLTALDLAEINEIGGFVSRSFVISMAAALEEHNVVPCGTSPDRALPGGDHVQLVKWLRNCFAHGNSVYAATDQRHVRTRQLLESLFPVPTQGTTGFVYSIDTILEPLKDGTLTYIMATT